MLDVTGEWGRGRHPHCPQAGDVVHSPHGLVFSKLCSPNQVMWGCHIHSVSALLLVFLFLFACFSAILNHLLVLIFCIYCPKPFKQIICHLFFTEQKTAVMCCRVLKRACGKSLKLLKEQLNLIFCNGQLCGNGAGLFLVGALNLVTTFWMIHLTSYSFIERKGPQYFLEISSSAQKPYEKLCLIWDCHLGTRGERNVCRNGCPEQQAELIRFPWGSGLHFGNILFPGCNRQGQNNHKVLHFWKWILFPVSISLCFTLNCLLFVCALNSFSEFSIWCLNKESNAAFKMEFLNSWIVSVLATTRRVNTT